MTAVLSNEEFSKEVDKIIGSEPVVFVPSAVYDPDGDCIEFVCSPESFYAKRLDDLVTVYYGRESKKIVGVLIKGASKFLERASVLFPKLRPRARRRRLKLKDVLTANSWRHDPNEFETESTYEQLIQVSQETEVQELCEA